MKRTAQKQLTRDDDPEEESEEGVQGLRKADDTVLAARKIRGLPKRAGTAAAAPPPSTNGTSAPVADKPKFGGFGGFSGFGGAAPAPAAPSTSSNATKTFASLVNSTKPTSTPPSPTPPAPTTNGGPDPAVKYYTSLRGLNASFVKALTNAVEEDPFRDLAGLLEQYRSHRIGVQSEFDTTAATAAPTPATSATPLPTPPSSFSGFGAPASAPKPATGGFSGFGAPPPTAPKPPSGGFSFGGSTTSTSTASSTSSKPATGGFTPDLSAAPAAKPGSFSFPSSTPSAFGSKAETKDSEPVEKAEDKDKEEKKDSAPVPTFGSAFKSGPIASTLFGSSSSSSSSNPFATSTSTSTGPSASLFGVSSASTPAVEKTGFSFGPSSTSTSSDKPASGFSFGAAKQTTMGKSPFTFGSATGDASPPASRTPPVGFSFGGPPPKFDLGPAVPKKDDGEKKEEEGKEEKKSGGFSFGSGGTGAFGGGSGGAFGSSGTGAFGSASGTGAFGSGSSTGAFKPFGSSTSASSPFASSGSGFSFGKPAESTGTVSPESGATPAPEGEDEGAGSGKDYDTVDDASDGEPTIHRVRAKVYRFRAAQGEKEAGWNDVGVGILRVRKNDTTSKRSVFLRNSSTGRVVFNFIIKSDMDKPTVSKKSVTFTGFPEGENVPTRFMVRTRSLDEAAQAGAAIEREIEFVKGSA